MTDSTVQNFSKGFASVIWLIALIFGLGLGVSKNTDTNDIQQSASAEDLNREILGSIEKYEVDNSIRFLKVRENGKIFLEAHILKEHDQRSDKVVRQKFEETRDAHLDFQGQVSNLFLKDIDGNGTWEIVLPFFDEFLIPRLHILSWDSATQELTPRKSSEFSDLLKK
jgi:hypothetical protein